MQKVMIIKKKIEHFKDKYSISIYKNIDMEFIAGDKHYTKFVIKGDVDVSIVPAEKKLITGDKIDENGNVITPSQHRSNSLQGILVISGTSFGRTGRNKLLYKCIPNNKSLPVFLVGYENKNKSFEKNKVDKFITFKMLHWKDKHPEGQIVETIGSVDNINAYAEYQLRCRGISVAIQKFNKDVYKRVTQLTVKANNSSSIPKLCQETYKIKTRIEGHNIISIDPEGCVDIDDAFEVVKIDEETSRLSIYISNVPLIIDYMNLWEHMPTRVSTIYLPDRMRPMLPTTLSEGLSSLKKGAERTVLALDVIVERNEYGIKIRSSTFVPCLAQVNNNYAYESAEMFIDENYINGMALVRDLNLLNPLVDNVSDSHKLVEWMMLYYNCESAKFLEGKNMGIFRSLKTRYINSVPKEIEDFVKGWHSSGGNYTRDTKSHDMIGHLYAHTTSPIRRLVDFINVFEINRLCGVLYHNLNDFTLLCKVEDITWLNAQMKGIRRVQNEVKLLNIVTNNVDGIKDNTQEGYIVDIDEVYATVYFSKLGFVNRYKYGSAKPRLYVKNMYTIHLFNDEHNLKQKVRISLV
ncbi:MAG: hypothetical protein CMI79_06610 [Candidatus Pelagibacter sp.]|nr:hypothetical protein [Candidatus Pelagibacter sp.]